MAGIDKIYGTDTQYDEFHAWVKLNKPDALKYFYEARGYTDNVDRPITNFPEKIDKWLLKNCPLLWVTDRIKEQYGLM